jgi:hypothetical protein
VPVGGPHPFATVALRFPDISIATWQGITSNQVLSQKRADNVREYLISQGMKPDLVSARGWGEANPVASARLVEWAGIGQQADIEAGAPVLNKNVPRHSPGDSGNRISVLPATSLPSATRQFRLCESENRLSGHSGRFASC